MDGSDWIDRSIDRPIRTLIPQQKKQQQQEAPPPQAARQRGGDPMEEEEEDEEEEEEGVDSPLHGLAEVNTIFFLWDE